LEGYRAAHRRNLVKFPFSCARTAIPRAHVQGRRWVDPLLSVAQPARL